MAIWQVDFSVIDKNKRYDDEDICYWVKEPNNAFDIAFLDKCESWSEDIIQYGDLQKTCIELLVENGKIVEINVRLDLRTLTKDLLMNVIDYIIRLNANVYFQNKIVIPSVNNVCNIIINSNAYKYCNNPLSYIDDLNEYDGS
ncbi:MAG: hypothetical protein J6N21_22385 [Butyrivibrio sp.]|nr:hypothetical protein [Butyrivibrio sp.]